ncbi:MAG: AAA domain-containing protein [Erysipelotrichaceae bacterium]|nr:AAA domain-containing protein [Erysipelotrichaceae bacterium]
MYNNRKKHLETIQNVSVAWAEAIRRREDIHGESIVPSDIYEAWKWKILSTKIDKMLEESPEELQKKSENLSRDLKRNTEELSEKKAWRYLTERISENNDLYKNLGAWKDTVKKIGKGTGKRAPMFRAKARDLMVKCQEAVPVWIMPIGKALESLNPIENKFDIVIVDEASQANILALAVIYMGKKVIIVGDDRQVSPMSIGEELSVIQTNQDRFLKGKIDNYHLFDGKTSIYDIAKLTFTPLMLKEHFRCVPEIIGFSNMLSYDYKIKPLRDASDTNLFPAIVNYQVFGGEKNSKDENVIEAQRIISLLKACIIYFKNF